MIIIDPAVDTSTTRSLMSIRQLTGGESQIICGHQSVNSGFNGFESVGRSLTDDPKMITIYGSIHRIHRHVLHSTQTYLEHFVQSRGLAVDTNPRFCVFRRFAFALSDRNRSLDYIYKLLVRRSLKVMFRLNG